MPESRQEKFKSRLFQFARSLVRIQMPRISEGDPSSGDIESDNQPEEIKDNELPRGIEHQLFPLQHLERKWEELREVVLPKTDKRTNEIGPEEIDPEGIDYLESIVDTLDRRIDKLEEKRNDLLDQKRPWAEALENDTEVSDEDPNLRAVQSFERRLEETEEKLSYLKFRWSLAEAILTQIAVLDTVQTWEEFHPRARSKDMGDHEKRTVVLGLMLNHIREERGYLPESGYETYEEFFSEVARVGSKYFACQGPAVARSVQNTGCWITGKEGEKAKYLREILRRVIDFARSQTWRPEEEVLSTLKKTALEVL